MHENIPKILGAPSSLNATYRRDLAPFRLIPFMDNDPAYLPDRTFYLGNWLSQFTRNYTQTTKRGLLTTNTG